MDDIIEVRIKWRPTLIRETKAALGKNGELLEMSHWDSRMQTEREILEPPSSLVLEWADSLIRGAGPLWVLHISHGANLTSEKKILSALSDLIASAQQRQSRMVLWLIDEIDKVAQDAKAVLDELIATACVSYQTPKERYIFGGPMLGISRTEMVTEKLGPLPIMTLVTTGFIGPTDRSFPAEVQRAIWERDGGRCRICGSTQHLQFDHVIPFSKGGSSLTAENGQLLCDRCNRSKSAKIGG